MLMREVLKNKLKYDNSMYENIYAYAYNFFTAGQYDKAKDIFKILLILNPQEIKGFIALGGCLQKLSDHQHAVHVYNAGHLVDPHSVTILLNIGLCYMSMEKLAMAEESFLYACMESYKDKETDPEKKFSISEKLWKVTRSRQKKQEITLQQSLIHID